MLILSVKKINCLTFITKISKFTIPIHLPFPIDLFFDSDSFYNCIPYFFNEHSSNYCNNNILTLDVKQLNKIMKFYYFYTFKAL